MIDIKKTEGGLEFIADADENVCSVVKDIIIGIAQPGERDFSLRLCLAESINNAIRHGNNYSGKIKIGFAKTRDYVQVRVEDFGNGFNLADVPDPLKDENLDKPSGRGIKLIMAHADKVEYNENGNCVTFGFYRCGK